MTKKFRMSYLKAIYQRYRKASKAVKTQILDEFCRVCGYHRKYAVSKLRSWPEPSVAKTARPRRHPKTYDSQVLRIVTAIWEAANYPWSAFTPSPGNYPPTGPQPPSTLPPAIGSEPGYRP